MICVSWVYFHLRLRSGPESGTAQNTNAFGADGKRRKGTPIFLISIPPTPEFSTHPGSREPGNSNRNDRPGRIAGSTGSFRCRNSGFRTMRRLEYSLKSEAVYRKFITFVCDAFIITVQLFLKNFTTRTRIHPT